MVFAMVFPSLARVPDTNHQNTKKCQHIDLENQTDSRPCSSEVSEESNDENQDVTNQNDSFKNTVVST